MRPNYADRDKTRGTRPDSCEEAKILRDLYPHYLHSA